MGIREKKEMKICLRCDARYINRKENFCGNCGHILDDE